MSDAIPGLNQPPTAHSGLISWVNEIAALTRPARVQWCDGSQHEWDELTRLLVEQGTLIPLNPELRPGSFLARSDPSDVARVEDRTFICSEKEEDAGPTNNWIAPDEMRQTFAEIFDGSMAGRTMYVVPFCMGPLGSAISQLGVEITDSPYVAASMRIMTRMGAPVLQELGGDGFFVRAVHSVGAPLAPGQADVPWPATRPSTSRTSPRPGRSGRTGPGTAGTRCWARSATRCGSPRPWPVTRAGWPSTCSSSRSPRRRARPRYIAAAFPSACGKTNLAMLQPTIPGWTVETVGDDIAWMRFGADGRLYAINPEAGFFGVAPGTSAVTNPNALKMLTSNTVFTNVALTDDGDVWWEGLTDEPPAHLTDWQGRDWTPASGSPAAHPNSRFTVDAAQCPSIAPEWDDPAGVPISAILFGGRRATAVPLVTEAYSWQHGVFLGATVASETTAAAAGQVGQLRHDPFAMLPFCGYNMGDYFGHWLKIGGMTDPEKLPRIYAVNWFRKDGNGRFAWPGFGENSRVLKWITQRLAGDAAAQPTAIGNLPTPGIPGHRRPDRQRRRPGPAAVGGHRHLAGRGRPHPASTSRCSAATCPSSCGTSTRGCWSG